jgi:hypothetical protein
MAFTVILGQGSRPAFSASVTVLTEWRAARTPRPRGREGTQPVRVSTDAERGNPDGVWRMSGTPGILPVSRPQGRPNSPAGQRCPRKRMPAAERQRETGRTGLLAAPKGGRLGTGLVTKGSPEGTQAVGQASPDCAPCAIIGRSSRLCSIPSWCRATRGPGRGRRRAGTAGAPPFFAPRRAPRTAAARWLHGGVGIPLHGQFRRHRGHRLLGPRHLAHERRHRPVNRLPHPPPRPGLGHVQPQPPRAAHQHRPRLPQPLP